MAVRARTYVVLAVLLVAVSVACWAVYIAEDGFEGYTDSTLADVAGYGAMTAGALLILLILAGAIQLLAHTVSRGQRPR